MLLAEPTEHRTSLCPKRMLTANHGMILFQFRMHHSLLSLRAASRHERLLTAELSCSLSLTASFLSLSAPSPIIALVVSPLRSSLLCSCFLGLIYTTCTDSRICPVLLATTCTDSLVPAPSYLHHSHGLSRTRYRMTHSLLHGPRRARMDALASSYVLLRTYCNVLAFRDYGNRTACSLLLILK